MQAVREGRERRIEETGTKADEATCEQPVSVRTSPTVKQQIVASIPVVLCLVTCRGEPSVRLQPSEAEAKIRKLHAMRTRIILAETVRLQRSQRIVEKRSQRYREDEIQSLRRCITDSIRCRVRLRLHDKSEEQVIFTVTAWRYSGSRQGTTQGPGLEQPRALVSHQSWRFLVARGLLPLSENSATTLSPSSAIPFPSFFYPVVCVLCVLFLCGLALFVVLVLPVRRCVQGKPIENDPAPGDSAVRPAADASREPNSMTVCRPEPVVLYSALSLNFTPSEESDH
ncbi:hypothetical protein Q8A73_012575 [Channa argus]|nr:hypothetical protein Q8A73_012575 [Channa argus]